MVYAASCQVVFLPGRRYDIVQSHSRCMPMTLSNGMTPPTTLEERVAALEETVAQLLSQSDSAVAKKDWRSTLLDWSANGRIWTRYGNRSPYKPVAPHGVYPCLGEDRWLTIACFTEAEWHALTGVAGHPEWAADPRFVDLAGRLAHQEALDT